MRPKKGSSLGADPSHQRLMLRNLAQSLFEHERIRTTEAKAKMLRPFAERLITKAKKGSIHHRRQVLTEIEDREIVHKLFAEIGPRFSDRPGGYTRILKIGPRQGDAAPMALVELVEGAVTTTAGEDQARPKRRRRRRETPEDKPVQPSGAAAAASGAAEVEAEKDTAETPEAAKPEDELPEIEAAEREQAAAEGDAETKES